MISFFVAAACLMPPVDGPIVDHFREPACDYCPGNRGLEYLVPPDTEVRLAAAGTVEFAGSVAGVRYVVVRHRDGRRATYGRLDAIVVREGQALRVGQSVGRAGGDFYFGLREGERYVDPEPMLGTVRGRPRLVPIDGTPVRSDPTSRLRCPAGR